MKYAEATTELIWDLSLSRDDTEKRRREYNGFKAKAGKIEKELVDQRSVSTVGDE